MIDMSKRYRTRDGRCVRILCVDARSGYRVVGLVMDGDGIEVPQSWTALGEHDVSALNSCFDLVEISPYEDWSVDAPIWVRDDRCQAWRPKHFAGIAEGSGRPLAYAGGCTSHTAKFVERIVREVRLASEFTPTAEERGE